MSPVVKSGKICSTGIAIGYNDTTRLIMLINPPTSPRGIGPRGKDFYDAHSYPRQDRGVFWEGGGIN